MYNGWLIKIGSYIIPNSIIKADTYSAYINMQDVDDWTDASGYLHRQAVELKALKVEFETVPQMDNTRFANLMSSIYANFTNAVKRECVIEAYIPETDGYVSQTGYMADIQPQIYLADSNRIRYNPIRFAFIGGVYTG